MNLQDILQATVNPEHSWVFWLACSLNYYPQYFQPCLYKRRGNVDCIIHCDCIPWRWRCWLLCPLFISLLAREMSTWAVFMYLMLPSQSTIGKSGETNITLVKKILLAQSIWCLRNKICVLPLSYSLVPVSFPMHLQRCRRSCVFCFRSQKMCVRDTSMVVDAATYLTATRTKTTASLVLPKFHSKSFSAPALIPSLHPQPQNSFAHQQSEVRQRQALVSKWFLPIYLSSAQNERGCYLNLRSTTCFQSVVCRR